MNFQQYFCYDISTESDAKISHSNKDLVFVNSNKKKYLLMGESYPPLNTMALKPLMY